MFVALLALAFVAANPAAIVGDYDGGQMEIAAGLELSANGRFRYAMTYGAMDEYAEGSWSADDGRVTLKADRAETNYPDGGKPDSLQLVIDGKDLLLDRYERKLRFRRR